MERMAAGQPPDREPATADGAMRPDRLQRVLAAGWQEPAARGEQRADEAPVSRESSHEHPLIMDLLPALPPQQCAEYQVEIGGEVRLACGGRPGIGTYHKQATSRKRPQVPAGEVAEPPPDPVPHHGRADRSADHESHPGGLILAGANQQMAGQQRPPGPVTATGRRELRVPPHPGHRGKHRGSPWREVAAQVRH